MEPRRKTHRKSDGADRDSEEAGQKRLDSKDYDDAKWTERSNAL